MNINVQETNLCCTPFSQWGKRSLFDEGTFICVSVIYESVCPQFGRAAVSDDQQRVGGHLRHQQHFCDCLGSKRVQMLTSSELPPTNAPFLAQDHQRAAHQVNAHLKKTPHHSQSWRRLYKHKNITSTLWCSWINQKCQNSVFEGQILTNAQESSFWDSRAISQWSRIFSGSGVTEIHHKFPIFLFQIHPQLCSKLCLKVKARSEHLFGHCLMGTCCTFVQVDNSLLHNTTYRGLYCPLYVRLMFTQRIMVKYMLQPQ